uniref:Midnolin n=1 Tax=Gasterosteus aculeatus TaxID=69293 RepID=G3PR25_GASAC|nr:midnolin-like [Gasterosteus aculeatus aculeatus]
MRRKTKKQKDFLDSIERPESGLKFGPFHSRMEQQRGLCSFAPGCQAGVSPGQPTMRLSITSTAGGPVELTVPRGESVEGLRAQISHRLRLQTDRIVLLYRDTQLTAGQLLDLGVTDGSKLTLVPAIEAGLVCSAARGERTMMDVLESLTEVQISDFLSGRSPLTVNLGIGAHMMYVQLQLSAQNVAELQHHQDLRAGASGDLQAGLPTGARMSQPDFSNKTAGSTSQTSTRVPDSSDSTSSNKLRAERPRTPALPDRSRPAQSTPTPPPVISTPPLPSGQQPAAAPVRSHAPTGSAPGPRCPASASTPREGDIPASSAAERSKQPGAVIESFVSPSPGVLSGTFTGTLAPCGQRGFSHPRRGIGIILQIFNDLIRAAYNHQGSQPVPPRNPDGPDSNPPGGVLLPAAEGTRQAEGQTPATQKAKLLRQTQGEESQLTGAPTQENQTLHYKLERLQLLMNQRRLRRQTRRYLQTSRPYRHHQHRL